MSRFFFDSNAEMAWKQQRLNCRQRMFWYYHRLLSKSSRTQENFSLVDLLIFLRRSIGEHLEIALHLGQRSRGSLGLLILDRGFNIGSRRQGLMDCSVLEHTELVFYISFTARRDMLIFYCNDLWHV